MKILLAFALSLVLLTAGCHNDDCYCPDNIVYMDSDTPPVPPTGLRSITHDEYVILRWNANFEDDVKGYNIYYTLVRNGDFVFMAYTTDTVYFDEDVDNGVTYLYGITAVDCNDNESDLVSMTFDTPRPEGFDVKIYNFDTDPTSGGFSFVNGQITGAWSDAADIVFSYDEIINYYYVQVIDDYIQHFGFTNSIDELDYSPEGDDAGWSQIGEVEAIEGHSYIIRTYDNHYAKFRIKGLDQDYMIFDWAYQIDQNNPQLLTSPTDTHF
jgi:hypothetical protein